MGSDLSSPQTNDDMVDAILPNTELRVADEIAMRSVDRGLFVPEERTIDCYSLKPMNWKGMTISSPLIYADALKYLNLEPGDRFLNVGSGSGYFSCIAGVLIADSGINVGLEIKPKLVEYSKQCLGRVLERCSSLRLLGFIPPQFYCGSVLRLEEIFPENAFNKIYCGFELSPEAVSLLIDFLRPGGTLVAPWLRRLHVVDKKADSSVIAKSMCVSLFEPIITDDLSLNTSFPKPIGVFSMRSLYKMALHAVHRLVVNSVLQHYPGFELYHSGRSEVDCDVLFSPECTKKRSPQAVRNVVNRLDNASCRHIMAWECHELLRDAVAHDIDRAIEQLPIPAKLRRSLFLRS